MKNHKLSKDGSVQKTVYGLLRNPTFDPSHGDGYIGTKSAKLTKTESLNPENQEQGAVVSVIRADRTRIMGERCIDYVTDKNVDDGWERLVLTFQLPTEETISVFVGMTRVRGNATSYAYDANMDKMTAVEKLQGTKIFAVE